MAKYGLTIMPTIMLISKQDLWFVCFSLSNFISNLCSLLGMQKWKSMQQTWFDVNTENTAENEHLCQHICFCVWIASCSICLHMVSWWACTEYAEKNKWVCTVYYVIYCNISLCNMFSNVRVCTFWTVLKRICSIVLMILWSYTRVLDCHGGVSIGL